jgi:hypothetical protein
MALTIVVVQECARPQQAINQAEIARASKNFGLSHVNHAQQNGGCLL